MFVMAIKLPSNDISKSIKSGNFHTIYYIPLGHLTALGVCGSVVVVSRARRSASVHGEISSALLRPSAFSVADAVLGLAPLTQHTYLLRSMLLRNAPNKFD